MIKGEKSSKEEAWNKKSQGKMFRSIQLVSSRILDAML